MRRYVIAYVAWLSFVLVSAAVALAWYRHVEQIGLRELGERLKHNTDNTSNASNT